jgi:hypothetical protein
MKIALYILFVFSVSASSYSQVSGVIQDANSKKTIPYANIAVFNSSKGTTANEDGIFSITDVSYGDTIVISAVGYEKAFHRIEKESFNLYLKPRLYQIPELEVSNNYPSILTVIEPFKKRSRVAYYVCYGSPWMNGRIFHYLPEYSQTPFIKEIRVLTKSKITGAKFNVRLMNVSDAGVPEEDLLTENLIVEVPKGMNKSSIDISKNRLPFPPSGICVALEWLIIDENIYYSRSKSPDSGERKGRIEPKFGLLEPGEESNSWLYKGGSWHSNKELGNPVSNKDLAIEIVLSN